MAVALNKSTRILIDNFIDKYFSGENKVAIKEEALEIADSILEQSNKDLDNLATKGDLKDEIGRLELKMIETKYDLLKWLVTAQLAIAGLLLALIKLM